MKVKFILELYDTNDMLISSTECKSYREIVKLSKEEYHDCRAIHLLGNGTMKPKKYLHPNLKRLTQRMKILDYIKIE
jgi:hypothetical protein